VRLADLEPAQLGRLLEGPGLRVRTGPVVSCIHSDVPQVRAGLALHYAQHTVEPDDGFADFHISIERPRGLPGWLRPRVSFYFDGQEPFARLPGDQGFPMLEWGLNWCVSAQAHQFLILHAAVLERGGRALILPAPSGSGKSTLCAGLAFSGWRLLSDELTLLDPTCATVVPLPRPISLKNASIDVMRAFAADAVFGPVVSETSKGSVAHVRPPLDAVLRADERALPGWVVLPRFEAGAATSLQPLSKGRAMMRLIECSFNYNVYGRQGFEMLADAVERSDCYELSYSNLHEVVAAFDALAAAKPPIVQ
jgi:HprK-related kinase A